MPGDRLVRARWRLAEVKAFADERQLINEGAISAFYPMALCAPLPGRPIVQEALAQLGPRTGATEKDRCLAKSRVRRFASSLPLKHGDWPWWFKWVRPGKDAGVIPHWGFRPFSALRECGCVLRNVSGGSPARFVQPVWHGELLTSQEAEPKG
jgi:hypothetical protein